LVWTLATRFALEDTLPRLPENTKV
jgi:hypothetical protein